MSHRTENTAYVSGGAAAEIAPLAILKLRAAVQRLYYFGTLGCIAELPDGDWSPERLEALEDADSGRAMPATRMELGALLQAAVGPVVALVDNAYDWVLTEVPPLLRPFLRPAPGSDRRALVDPRGARRRSGRRSRACAATPQT